MNIKFKNKEVERQCTNYKVAVKTFGEIVAEKLHSLINFIENAESLRDVAFMPNFHFHKLQGKRKKDSQYAMDVNGRKSSYRLIITPLDKDGNIVCDDGKMALYETTDIILILEVSKHYE